MPSLERIPGSDLPRAIYHSDSIHSTMSLFPELYCMMAELYIAVLKDRREKKWWPEDDSG